MKTFKEFMLEERGSGTYAATKPDAVTAQHWANVLAKHGVPNIEDHDKLHCTLLYSRKELHDYVPNPDLEHPAVPTSLEVWPTRSGANCLVMKVHAPTQEERHKHLMDVHQATYDYPDYKTHISLSYDIGDFDHSHLPSSKFPSNCIKNTTNHWTRLENSQ